MTSLYELEGRREIEGINFLLDGLLKKYDGNSFEYNGARTTLLPDKEIVKNLTFFEISDAAILRVVLNYTNDGILQEKVHYILIGEEESNIIEKIEEGIKAVQDQRYVLEKIVQE